MLHLLNIGLAYIVIGFIMALFVYFILRKNMVGNFWLALVIGMVGSFVGGVLEFFLADLFKFLSNINGSINIFPSLITSFIVLSIYSKFSTMNKDD